MPTDNHRVARLLYELGVLSERLDDRSRRFRARAYRRAAEAVAAMDADVLEMPDEALTAVPGIGAGTAARIAEIRRTGTIARLEELRALDPGGAEDLLRVPGLGPRTVARLRGTLGVHDVAGLDRAAMRAQRKQIVELRRRYDSLAVLHGAELNIATDGTLDDDAMLAGFDWAVASVHSRFDLDVGDQTRRVVAAIRHPAVRAIGHLTAHRTGDLSNHRWGVRQARRGRVPRDLVTNTWPVTRFLQWARASV